MQHFPGLGLRQVHLPGAGLSPPPHYLHQIYYKFTPNLLATPSISPPQVDERGWSAWPVETYLPPIPNPRQRERPRNKRQVDFSNNTFFTGRWHMRLNGADHLYDRLLLADLTVWDHRGD